jgi:hypothetical protein
MDLTSLADPMARRSYAVSHTQSLEITVKLLFQKYFGQHGLAQRVKAAWNKMFQFFSIWARKIMLIMKGSFCYFVH